MDPNKTLDMIRNFYNSGNEEDFFELTELVESLDKWLSYGGFLPKEWDLSNNE